MAKDDNSDFTPVTFTRTGEDGKDRELIANSPADAVRLKFDGWTEKPANIRAKPAGRPGSTSTPAAAPS